MKRIMILASGTGSTAESIIKYFDGHKEIKIDKIVSNNAKAGVLAVASKYHISSISFDNASKDWSNLFYSFIRQPPDLIVLAGFLKKLKVPDEYKNKIINIHPSLLPKYGGQGMYGIHVHRAVLANKENISGCTIHYVNEEYDKGEIIAQAFLDVSIYDTPNSLMNRVKELERELYPRTIELLLQ